MSDAGLSVPPEARPFQGRRAGVVTRVVAASVDGVVVALVLVVAYVAVAGLLFLLDPRGFTFPQAKLLRSMAAAFGVLVVYLTLAWWLTGRSVGQRVMGVRVVGRRGRDLRLVGAFVRALCCAGFPIGLLWVAVNRENRSVQDVLLRTSVIYDWQPRHPARPGPG